jgi:hypothetical protein
MYRMTRVGLYIYIWRHYHGTTLKSIMAALEAADAVFASLRGLDEFQIEAAWETSVSSPRSGLSTRPSDFDLC